MTQLAEWWSEWQEHLLCGSLKIYCIALDENYQGADDEVNTETPLVAFLCYTAFLYFDKSSYQVDGTPPPTISRSGQPIRYAPPIDYPLIAYNAPTLADVAAGKKRKMTSTKKTIQKNPSSSCRTLAFASAPDADVPTDAHDLASPDIAAEDTDEEDIQEIASQTSPIVQVLRLLIHHLLTDI